MKLYIGIESIHGPILWFFTSDGRASVTAGVLRAYSMALTNKMAMNRRHEQTPSVIPGRFFIVLFIFISSKR
jgi:hypothetical protein